VKTSLIVCCISDSKHLTIVAAQWQPFCIDSWVATLVTTNPHFFVKEIGINIIIIQSPVSADSLEMKSSANWNRTVHIWEQELYLLEHWSLEFAVRSPDYCCRSFRQERLVHRAHPIQWDYLRTLFNPIDWTHCITRSFDQTTTSATAKTKHFS